MTAMASSEVHVTVGIDTHVDVHVAAAVDQLGRLWQPSRCHRRQLGTAFWSHGLVDVGP